MATDWARIRANYEARLLAISEEIANLGPDKAGGLPDYKGSGGVEHQAYLKQLEASADWLRVQLAKIPGEGGQSGTSVRIINI